MRRKKRAGKKREKARKVTERKLVNTHLLETCETIFKYDGKKGGKGAKKAGGEEGTERKMGNMHLVEAGKASFK
jgi:hypothetical protein